MLKFINPFTWFQWFGQFLYLWLLSIPWRDAPKAIPAIVLIIVLCTAGMIAWNDDSGWRNRLMVKQIRAAWEKDDFSTAELVLRRQLVSRPDDEEVAFTLALARDQQLEHEEALEMMRRLVVRNHEGAARWLLRHEYIGKNWTELKQPQRDEFGSILAIIHRQSPDDIRIKELYADYLIVSQKLSQALDILKQLARVEPMRGLQAAAIARRLGQFPTADLLAEETLKFVSKKSFDDPTNTLLALAVAQNQLFLKRYRKAIITLQNATKNAKTANDTAKLNQAMGDALIAWITFIEESPTDTAVERAKVLQMLEYALKTAPNNPRVLTVVADRVLKTLADDEKEIVQRRKALIAGSSPGIQHFIEGTSALMQDDVDSALMHLTIASELMPQSGAIMNNLAVALTAREDADLERALKVANVAINNMPSPSAHFYETRGQILFRMGEHLKAIPDLTRALKVTSLAKNAHKALAECYRELGQAELSKEHELAAKRLEKFEAAKE